MKNLKVMMMALTMSLVSLMSFGQLHIDDFYADKAQNIIYSEVYEFDSLSQEDIQMRVKNWAGTQFVNMKEVLVGETKEQLVFNYITESFYIKLLGMPEYKTWYIRMVVQMKDNKIKVSLFDDGNAFWPGTYSRGISTPATSARSIKFSAYFKTRGKKEGLALKMCQDGLINIKNSCEITTKNLIKSLNTDIIIDSGW